MTKKEREEFKQQLLASLAETKRMAAETKQMADEACARNISDTQSASPAIESLADSNRALLAHLDDTIRRANRPMYSTEQMWAHIDKLKKEFEEQRKYNRLPWWKRLFTDRPTSSYAGEKH